MENKIPIIYGNYTIAMEHRVTHCIRTKPSYFVFSTLVFVRAINYGCIQNINPFKPIQCLSSCICKVNTCWFSLPKCNGSLSYL